jgi:outer membrane protein assembly factor BamD
MDNKRSSQLKKQLSVTLLCIVSALAFISCSSSKEVESLSVEERFAQAMHKFKEGDYLDAIEDFKIVTIQFPGSAVADDAQFNIAECRYLRDEYILAGAEYDLLVRTMPSSSLVPKARYMKAMSGYNLSPKPDLDQKYTHEAIDDFQTYIEYSPADTLAKDAATKIAELINKLAKKEFENGKLYYRLEYYKAAIAYFDNVMERFHDSEYADDALLGKARAMRDRRDYAGALDAIHLFLEKYPASDLKNEIESLKSEVEEDIANAKVPPKASSGLTTKNAQ